MILVSGRFRLPPERIAEALPAMAKVIAASLAAQAAASVVGSSFHQSG